MYKKVLERSEDIKQTGSVKFLNQLNNLTSKDTLPVLVKKLNQSLVKKLNPILNTNPSINHQNINT